MKKAFLLLLQLSLITVSLTAQLHSVKDNIACLYGLKNEKGEWVVPPEFTSLDKVFHNQYSYFYSYKNGKYGAISNDGKELLPPIYQGCYNYGTHGPGRFIVYIDNKLGLVNSENEFIIKPEFRTLCHIEDGVYLYSIKGKKYGLMDTTGFITPEKFYYPDFKKHFSNYVMKYFASGKRRKLMAGILNLQLKPILPAEFDELSVFETIILASKNGLYGFYNYEKDSAKLLVPLIYDEFKSSIDGYYFSNQVIAMNEKDKWGLMTTNGKIYIAPQFDSIAPIKYASRTQWIYFKNKLSGIIDSTGKIVTPPIYNLVPINYSTNGWNGYYVSLNNKQGIMNEDGSFLLDPKYYRSYNSQYQEDFYYTEKTALLFKLPSNYGTWSNEKTYQLDTCSTIFENTKWKLYTFNKKIYPVQKKKVNDSLLVNYEGSAIVTPQYFGYTIFHNNKNESYDFRGNIIYRPLDNKAVYKIKDAYYLYTASNGKFGAIDDNGTILLDTVYYRIFNGYKDETLWIKFNEEDGCAKKNTNKNPEECGWYLCDLNAQKVCDIEFDFVPSEYGQIIPVRVNQKFGLFDQTKKSFIVQPEFESLGKPTFWYSRAHFYLGFNPSGFRIFDGEGNSLSDKEWNKIMPLNYPVLLSDYLDSGFIKTKQAIQVCLIFNDTSDTLLMSVNGDTCSNTKIIRQIMINASLLDDEHKNSRNTNYGTSFTLFQILSNEQQKENINYAVKQSFEKFGENYRYRPSKIPYNYKFGNSANHISYQTIGHEDYPEYSKDDYMVLFVNDKAISFIRNYDAGVYYSHYDKQEYYNFYAYENGLKEIAIDSLFKKDIHTPYVMEGLIEEAISLREGVVLDCNKPGSYFTQTKGRFQISKEGINIVLFDFYSNSVTYTIPWIKLKPYAPEKGIVADFLNQ